MWRRRGPQGAAARLHGKPKATLPPGTPVVCATQEGSAGFPETTKYLVLRPLPGSRLRRQAGADRARLSAAGMPGLEATSDVLAFLDIDLRAFLALANPTDRVRPHRTNYVEWSVAKKRGGTRIICSPKPRLKAAQRKIKEEILDRAPLSDVAHGFV